MVKTIGQFKSSRYQALVDRGDYAAAGEELRPNLGINEYTLISSAIRAGDIAVAEKLVEATIEVKEKKLNKSRMLDTLADLATVAYWLGHTDISDRALFRYPRYGYWHRYPGDQQHLRFVQSGGQFNHPAVWRNRSGAGHLPSTRASDGRLFAGTIGTRSGQYVRVPTGTPDV